MRSQLHEKLSEKLRRLKEGKHFSPQSEVKITYDKSNVPPKPLRELDYGDGKKKLIIQWIGFDTLMLGEKIAPNILLKYRNSFESSQRL